MEEELSLGHIKPIQEYGPEARAVIVHLEAWARKNPRAARFRGRYITRHLEEKHGIDPEVTADVLWELFGRPGTLPGQM